MSPPRASTSTRSKPPSVAPPSSWMRARLSMNHSMAPPKVNSVSELRLTSDPELVKRSPHSHLVRRPRARRARRRGPARPRADDATGPRLRVGGGEPVLRGAEAARAARLPAVAPAPGPDARAHALRADDEGP